MARRGEIVGNRKGSADDERKEGTIRQVGGCSGSHVSLYSLDFEKAIAAITRGGMGEGGGESNRCKASLQHSAGEKNFKVIASRVR